MRRFISPFSIGVFMAFVCLTVVLGVIGARVHADILDNTGPNADQFGDAKAYYELSNTSQVVTTDATIPVYYPYRPGGTIQISVSCKGGSGTVQVTIAGTTTNICQGGTNTDFGIPASVYSGVTADPNTGYFEYDVNVHLTGAIADSNYRAFKFTAAPADKVIIGYSASNSSHFAIANVNRCDSSGDPGCGNYSTYSLPFAAPCNITSRQSSFQLFDEDNTGTGNQYNIQPYHKFDIQMKRIAPSGATSTITFGAPDAGAVGNNQTATYYFNMVQGYKYQLQLVNVYSNNVIQFRLPYDSINYTAECTAGQFSSDAGCDNISGYLYDKYDDSALVYYYIVINPASGDAQNTYSDLTTFQADLDIYARGTANQSVPPGHSLYDGHWYSQNLPASSYRGHNYNGPWQPNTYYLYAREEGTDTVRLVDTMTPNSGKPCASANCSSNMTSFSNGTVNQSNPFKVWFTGNSYAGSPLPDSYFAVRVLDPDGNTIYYNDGTPPATPSTAPASQVSATLSGSQIISPSIPFTPTKPGTYTVRWNWDGIPTCSSTADFAFSPYFTVSGGDISAGNGFNWTGSGCSNTTDTTAADIRSQNADSGSYSGANNRLAAIASGSIDHFVSGLGLPQNSTYLDDSDSQNGHGLSFSDNTAAGNYVTPSNYGGLFAGANPTPSTTFPCVHDYQADAPAASRSSIGTPGNITSAQLSSAATGNYTGTTSGSPAVVTLGDGSDIVLSGGKQVTLYVRGYVYIKSNITYSYSSVSQIPQFRLIVQGTIYIAPNVTDLHGIYLATKYSYDQDGSNSSGGYIATCSPAPGVHNQDDTTGANACTQQLTFTGAVAAENKIYMDRTYGSLYAASGVPAAPAEVFRYSPELWLNPASTSGSNSLVYQAFTGLPPVL